MFTGKGRPLSEDGVNQAASTLGVGLHALWAVMTVETRGCGFLADRRPQILFERHIFHDLTAGAFDTAAPDLSSPVAGGYGPAGAYQYERLHRAISLNRIAALQSASWGLGQVMGFNAAEVGFDDVEAMVTAMSESEDAQFQGMVRFIVKHGLQEQLQESDWVGFAYQYNGPSFRKNDYDRKLALASSRFKVGPLPNLTVRAAQLYLTYLGFSPGGVDGWFGVKTQTALLKFQKAKGMPADGLLDEGVAVRLEQEVMG